MKCSSKRLPFIPGVEIVRNEETGNISIGIRDEKEFNRLTALAQSKGLTLDQFIRDAVQQAIAQAKTVAPDS